MINPKKIAKITIPIKLHEGQRKIADSPARFKVVMAGRRFGKSEFGLWYILDRAARYPGTKHWLVFPTAVQGRRIMWERLLSFLPPEIIKGRPNSTRMDVKLINSSEISIRGSDNEKSLRGTKLKTLLMDEAALQRVHIWEEIFRPALVDLLGSAVFISSPMGKNWFYKLWAKAKEANDPEWAAFHFTIYDNPTLDRAELDKLKIVTPARIWAREYMGQALEDEGCVYGEYGIKNSFDPLEYPGHEKYQCGRGMDWGYGIKGDPAACVWVHLSPDKKILVSALHKQQNWSVPKHAEVIKQVSAGRPIADGMTVLDRSAFRVEGTSEMSIAGQFQKQGIPCVMSEKSVDVGIDIVKRLLEEGRLLISNKCYDIQQAMKDWEFGQHEPDELCSLRYILVHMVRRQLITIDKYANGLPKDAVPFRPNNLEQRRATGKSQDISWDFDNGCLLD